MSYVGREELESALHLVRSERNTLRGYAVQLRQALLWARERLAPSGLVNAEELLSLDDILEGTKALDG